MKFRTEIDIAPLHTRIGYEHRTLALGSCFAEQIGARLARAKFRVTVNPTGILFNPLSIVAALRTATAGGGSTSASTATSRPRRPTRRCSG